MLNIWGVNPVTPADPPESLISNRRSNERASRSRNKQSVSLNRSPGYLPVSSIPDCSAPGLNYTFMEGSLCKKTKEQNVSEEYINPELLSHRPKRKYVKSPFYKTPERLKYSSEDVVLTIDTRLDSNLDEIDREKDKSIDRPSFLNDQSSFVKNSSLSRGMMETHDGEESDSEYEEYVKDSVPGPGAYNVNDSMIDKKTHSLFISRAERFKTIKKKPEVAPQEEPKNTQKRKPLKLRERLRAAPYRKCYPFESSQPRLIEERQEFVPGPGYYRPRQSIEEELIKKIQRDFKGKFGREEERFQVERNLSEQLGPGYYTIDNNGSQPPAPSSYFKSVVKRQLFNKPPRIPGVGTYQSETSPVKLYQDPEIDAPFGSKIKRFTQLPLIDRNVGQYTDSLDALGTHSLFELYKKRQEQLSRRQPLMPARDKYYTPKYEQTPGPGQYASEL